MEYKILIELEETSTQLITLLKGFNTKNINQVPYEGGWTAGQVGDHLLKSYGVIEVLASEVKPTGRAYGEKIERIKNIFLDFSSKLQSPDFIIPSSTPINREALLSSIEHRVSQLSRLIQTEDLSLTYTGFELPHVGEMTILEWIYFIIYHTQRHIQQLKNIAAILSVR